MKLAAEVALFLVAIMVAAAIVCLPIAWFDGHAKSAYIKQTQGIDIPWYQSTWLNVQVQTNNVNLKQEKK